MTKPEIGEPLTLSLIGDMMLNELVEYHKRAKALLADSADALLDAREILRAIKAGAIVTPGGVVSPEKLHKLLDRIGFTEEEHRAGECDCATRPAGSSRSALLMHSRVKSPVADDEKPLGAVIKFPPPTVH